MAGKNERKVDSERSLSEFFTDGQFQRDLRDILAVFLSSWANNSANKSLNDIQLLPNYKKNDYVGWCQTKFL